MNHAPAFPSFGKRLLIPLVIMMMALADCAEPTAPEQGTGSLFPIAVGNRWIGKVTSLSPAGEITASGLDTVSIVAIDTIGSNTYFRNDLGMLYYERGGSLYLYDSPNRSFLVVKNNALSGERFEFDTNRASMFDSPCDTLITNLMLLSTSQSFQTPDGLRAGYTFTSEAYCRSDPEGYIRQDSSTDGFVRGVGLVTSRRYRRNGSQWYLSHTWELISYRVN